MSITSITADTITDRQRRSLGLFRSDDDHLNARTLDLIDRLQLAEGGYFIAEGVGGVAPHRATADCDRCGRPIRVEQADEDQAEAIDADHDTCVLRCCFSCSGVLVALVARDTLVETLGSFVEAGDSLDLYASTVLGGDNPLYQEVPYQVIAAREALSLAQRTLQGYLEDQGFWS